MIPIPNIWTHILFVDQLCERLDRQDILKSSSSLHLGAQGPDPFFYYQFWPFLESGKGEKLGQLLHTERCGPFLEDMIERGRYAKKDIQSFILGFVSHHVLDRRTHPYVHFHAGYEGNKHQELEVIIDTLMLQKHRNIKTWKTPVHKEIPPGRSLSSITDLMTELIKIHYPDACGTDLKRIIQQSYRDIYKAQRILFDPWGWKNKSFGTMTSSFSHQPVSEEKDYLNEQNHIWRHSATNEDMTSSFEDLYEAALEDGENLFSHILQYWSKSSATIMKIHEQLGNLSYDTGLPVKSGKPNLYSRPIV